MAAAATLGLQRGHIEAFDAGQGVGTLRAKDGAGYFFHCVAIADGSRDIATGSAVTFALAPGHLGRYEGVAISPLSA